jgi:hypothetical protein
MNYLSMHVLQKKTAYYIPPKSPIDIDNTMQLQQQMRNRPIHKSLHKI